MPRLTDVLTQRVDDALLSPRARAVRRRRLTSLSPRKLRALETALRQVRRAGVPGDFVECGVALGGSAVVIASGAGDGRAFHGYDLFDMLPSPGPQDGQRAHRRYAEIRSGRANGVDGDPYYAYVDDLYGRVCQTFSEFGLPVDGRRIALHRGPFERTLHTTEPQPVALAHIDCGWYDMVTCCLKALGPRLAPGGWIVLDDYNDYGGCRKALETFLIRHPGLRVLCDAPSAIVERLPDA